MAFCCSSLSTCFTDVHFLRSRFLRLNSHIFPFHLSFTPLVKSGLKLNKWPFIPQQPGGDDRMLPPTEIDPDDELLANTEKSFPNEIIYIYLFVIYFFAEYIWKVKDILEIAKNNFSATDLVL
jgi:hypothetical protein